MTKTPITLSIEKEINKIISQCANINNQSRSEFIEDLIKNYYGSVDHETRMKNVNLKIEIKKEEIKKLEKEQIEVKNMIDNSVEFKKTNDSIYNRVLKCRADEILVGMKEMAFSNCQSCAHNYSKSPEQMFSDAIEFSKKNPITEGEKEKVREKLQKDYGYTI